jgi:hypothetical protein
VPQRGMPRMGIASLAMTGKATPPTVIARSVASKQSRDRSFTGALRRGLSSTWALPSEARRTGDRASACFLRCVRETAPYDIPRRARPSAHYEVDGMGIPDAPCRCNDLILRMLYQPRSHVRRGAVFVWEQGKKWWQVRNRNDIIYKIILIFEQF